MFKPSFSTTNRLIALSVMGLLATALEAQSPAPKTNPQHPKSSPSTARATSSHATSRPRSRTSKSRSNVRRASGPTYQQHPDPQRYQEIQKALAERGYFKGEPNGVWGDDSTDAMKRFQTDQKLDPDGKINALSLTGLGLGPKHDGTSAASVAVPAPPPVDPSTTVPPAVSSKDPN